MENTPDQGIYTPRNVEVFDVHTALRMNEVRVTLQQMIGFLFTTILRMLSHPDRQTRSSIDPDHKYAIAVIAVTVDETSSIEEIEAGRALLVEQYDKFIEQSRPKFSRIHTPQPERQGGGLVLH